MATAWMIRNDGKAIPCVQHIYANPDNVEETLFAAEWLYEHTRHEESRGLVLETVAAWAASLSHTQDSPRSVADVIAQKPYRFLSMTFFNDHMTEIESIRTDVFSLPDLCKEVALELNQEFLRARYGGMYHTDAASREMFFRISSIGFDWYTAIHDFIAAADFRIERIMIVRDEESTGAKNKVYLRQPTEMFITAHPVILTLKRKIKGGLMMREISAHLACGDSVRQILQDLPINSGRLTNKLQVLSYYEDCNLMEFPEHDAAEGIFMRNEADDLYDKT